MKTEHNQGRDIIHFDDNDLAAVESYWTDERMANAIPVSMPEISQEELARLKKKATAIQAEETRSVDSFDPDSDSDDTPTDLEGAAKSRANVKKRPFWNGGKFFFTKSDGKDYAGSAQFCGSPYIILTAAHCVRDNVTGDYYTNFMFRRAYKNGGGQKVSIKKAVTQAGWVTGSNIVAYDLDYSFMVANKESGAGWLGWQTNIPYSSFTAIGYPSNIEKGKYMQQFTGQLSTNAGGVVSMLNNPMGPGCSGGAWIGDLTIPHVGGNYAIGLNSYSVSGQTDTEWSPLFDSAFADLYYAALALKDDATNTAAADTQKQQQTA